ncbi:MAG: primosomal protein N', partial [Solobacterium sp.]|nr:primosomal protein N' [Solobacterium sp.]
MYLLDCYIEHPVRTMDQTFTYYSEEPAETGVRVLVDFNHRTVTGFVESVRETEEVPEKIKPVLSILDRESLITPELGALAGYMKDITVSTTIACYQAMLPAKIKPGGKTKTTVK